MLDRIKVATRLSSPLSAYLMDDAAAIREAFDELIGKPVGDSFSRALLRERQADGVARAKARGAYKGRARTLSSTQAEIQCIRAAAGEPQSKPGPGVRISRQTLDEYLHGHQ